MLILVLVEWCSPGCAGVGEEDVDVVGGLGDLLYEGTDTGDLGGVGWDGDGFCAWLETWEGVEGGAGFFAGGGFAGCDVDFGSSGLEEPEEEVCQLLYPIRQAVHMPLIIDRVEAYPDAA